MFVYNGSKLEQDIEDLKNEAGKSEYEKIVEPYKKRIAELEKTIVMLRIDFDALFSASREVLDSLEQNYLKIVVNTSEPRAYYSEGVDFDVVDDYRFKTIAIPVKQNIQEQFDARFCKYTAKHAPELYKAFKEINNG